MSSRPAARTPLRFRPHHFLCSLGYAGKGYSASFTANMTAIVQGQLRATNGKEMMILVVGAVDDICTPCPKRRGISCENQNKISGLDLRHATALGLKIGEQISWGQALQLIKARVKPDDLDNICKGCQWLEYGMCKQALGQLHNEKTPPQSGTA